VLDGEIIFGFSESILSNGYDQKKPTPPFHKTMWDMVGSDELQVAMAAPRNHSKSTSITHAYVLAEITFRLQDYVVILSDTEEQASEFLGDIKTEIRDNEALQEMLRFKKFIKDSVTDIIVEAVDGHQFRIIAKGAEQKLRGRKWRGKRPGLIVGDDLENDEVVENPDRREKFRRWFFAACKQSLRDGGKIRIVGTILHEDSLLNRLLKNKTWASLLFKAHESFDDFSNILWPEKFSEDRLRKIREEFVEDGSPELYSQEYLNDPFDSSANFFTRSDFIPLDPNDDTPLIYYAGADFAISKKQRADYTAFKVIGINAHGRKKVVWSDKGRWDSLEIMDKMFEIQKDYSPELFFVESDKIEKSIGPFVLKEMHDRARRGDPHAFINFEKKTPSQDKRTRARPMQKEMRAHNVEWDTKAEWFPGCQNEFLRFDKGVHDDDVDSLGVIFLGLQDLEDAPSQEDFDEDEYYDEFGNIDTGRDVVCGY